MQVAIWQSTVPQVGILKVAPVCVCELARTTCWAVAGMGKSQDTVVRGLLVSVAGSQLTVLAKCC